MNNISSTMTARGISAPVVPDSSEMAPQALPGAAVAMTKA
jgi:hypothetical protein